MGRDYRSLPVDVPPQFLQSQFGQDRFVITATDHARDGTYCDIGAGEPWRLSNTLALQTELGWRGIHCDLEWHEAHKKQRSPLLNFADAFAVDWRKALAAIAIDGRIDFLSLDLEPPSRTEDVLRMLPLEDFRFSIICVEHDAYRDGGKERRERMRSLIAHHDYELIGTAGINGLDIDDFWVDPQAIDAASLRADLDAHFAEMTP